MTTACLAVLVFGLQLSTPTERLIAARTRAYDANFHNDAAGLRSAIAELAALRDDRDLGRMALYYAAWAEWSLVGSEVLAGRMPEALAAAERSVEYSREALRKDESDPEVVSMLVNGLIGVAVVDRPRLAALIPEIGELRRRALELGASSPRVVMMDAGMIFNMPPEAGGSKEKGLERWKQAVELFEREAKAGSADPLRPDWGLAIAYGGLSQLYLRMTPPEVEHAREAAAAALKLRPDFWYVKEQVLPRLTK